MREFVFVEELTVKILLVDPENNKMPKPVVAKFKSVEDFDERVKELDGKCFIAILNKNLFRSNCYNE